MTLLPDIREQLLDHAFPTEAPAGRRWRRGIAPALAIAASVAVCVAVLVAVARGHRPGADAAPAVRVVRLPSPPPRAWVIALGQAIEQIRRRESACRFQLAHRHGGPRMLLSEATPPLSITRYLSSLATPARGAQRVTPSDLRGLSTAVNDVYIRYAWQERVAGVQVYVLPAAVVGSPQRIPARCDRQELAAFTLIARRDFPAGRRAAAIAYARHTLSAQESGGVAIITRDGGVGGSYIGGAELSRLRTLPSTGGGSGGDNSVTTTTLLVSDRVASVTATYTPQRYPGRVRRTVTVTRRPTRNLVVFQFTGAWDPPKLTFRMKSGIVLRYPGPHGG